MSSIMELGRTSSYLYIEEVYEQKQEIVGED
jgi:hypothetical protein